MCRREREEAGEEFGDLGAGRPATGKAARGGRWSRAGGGVLGLRAGGGGPAWPARSASP